MRRSFIIGLALVATACGPPVVTYDRPPTTSTRPSTTSTTSPDVPTTIPDEPSTADPDDTQWAYQEWSVLSDVDPYDAVWGDPGMMVLGYSRLGFDDSPMANGLWLFDGETWSGTMLSEVTIPDEYGFTPDVTDLVWFGGRYLAFLMGDTTTTPGRASMLTSSDGLNWDLEYLGSALAAALPAGLYATPESPPWPGSSAATQASIHGNEITVAGWAVLGGPGEGSVSVPVIWRSTDGRTWSTTALPNANFDNEWASDVSIGPLGYLVEVAGPVHQSASFWYSPDGEDWTYIGDRFDAESRMLVSMAVGEGALLALMMDLENDTQPTSLWRSTNGLDWEEVEPPFRLEPPPDGYPAASLANSRKGLVAIVATSGGNDLWRTIDGLTWVALPSISLPNGEPPGRLTLAVASSTGNHLSLTTAAPGMVARWTEAAETRDVVLVSYDDVLNVRSSAGVANEIVATLSPATTGVVLTGRASAAGSSIWVEIITNEGTGWVNGYYLSVQDSAANPFSETIGVDLIGELAAVFAGRGDLTELGSRRGIFVAHHDRAKAFKSLDGLLTDPTLHMWAGTGCSAEECPDETPKRTFAKGVADSFLSAWNDDDRLISVDNVIPGGNGMLVESIVPTEFANLHFVAVKDPGDHPEYGGTDWFTWYVYFTYEDGVPVVLGMSIDQWAP